jgi:prevent-host-death family protein
MSEIGAYEARTRLPKLLRRVEKGERFVITRYGRPVAQLIPIGERDTKQVRAALAGLCDMRKAFAKRGIELKFALRNSETSRDLAHRDHRY